LLNVKKKEKKMPIYLPPPFSISLEGEELQEERSSVQKLGA